MSPKSLVMIVIHGETVIQRDSERLNEQSRTVLKWRLRKPQTKTQREKSFMRNNRQSWSQDKKYTCATSAKLHRQNWLVWLMLQNIYYWKNPGTDCTVWLYLSNIFVFVNIPIKKNLPPPQINFLGKEKTVTKQSNSFITTPLPFVFWI